MPAIVIVPVPAVTEILLPALMFKVVSDDEPGVYAMAAVPFP